MQASKRWSRRRGGAQGDVEYYGLEPWEHDKQSPTAGMNIAQRILHVGGRNNEAGYVEFGSIQAVEALVRQVLRDLPPHHKATEPAPSTERERMETLSAMAREQLSGQAIVYDTALGSMKSVPRTEPRMARERAHQGENHEQQVRPEMGAVGGQQSMESSGSGRNSNPTVLVSNIEALLALDAAGALVPHGIGGHARSLLKSAAALLSTPAPPSAALPKIGCVQHDCAECQARAVMPAPSTEGERPTKPGLFAWVPESGSPVLVLVDKRPSDHSPGGVLNGHVLQSPTFYNGCAIASWPATGWVDLRAALLQSAAMPVGELTYSLDADPQGIRARVVQAVQGALTFGARNENKPPKGHWLNEIWESARAEREDAVDRVATLFENMETPYLPDIANAIDGAAASSQPVREPLTDEQIVDALQNLGRMGFGPYEEGFEAGVHHAEAAHGIGVQP